MVRDLLQRDARTHMLAKESRQASIDAGLAAELILVRAFVDVLGEGTKLTKKYQPAGCSLKDLLERAPDHGIDVTGVFGDRE